MSRMTETLARQAVERTTIDRQTEYAREMQRIVEATYDLHRADRQSRTVAA